MLKQEVAFIEEPATLLPSSAENRAILLDGRSSQSWGDGTVVFADQPVETLEVYADSIGHPLELLQDFVTQQLEGNGCVGVFVALAYDLKHWVESLERRHNWPAHPLLYAAAFESTYVANRIGRKAEIRANSEASLASALRRISAVTPRSDQPARPLSQPHPQMPESDYIEMIDRTLAYIAAGDIYQANLAQSFRFEMPLERGCDLFQRWTTDFPTPFAAYVGGGKWSILCNSPECFLDIRGSSIATFPIKGTRGVEPGRPIAPLIRSLANDPKELAEHIMIVDLERNDLGRLCVPGSVHVPELQKICEFPMLIHMISEVIGTLRPDTSLCEILRATFPGGSITGAPKIRAMQIIEELEPVARGFYTGSLGWIEAPDRARFNIAIRSGYLDGSGLSFHAGGGIVADSQPAKEYAETFSKSQSLFHALSRPSGTTSAKARNEGA